MKISAQQPYYSATYKKVQDTNSNNETVRTLSNSQSNVNFKAVDTMQVSSLVLAMALGVGTLCCLKDGVGRLIKSLHDENIQTEKADESKVAGDKKEISVLKESASDVDDFEGVSNIKILQLSVPSIRESGFAGFMYQGKPYTTPFYYNDKASVKYGIFNKLSEINPERENYYKDKKSEMEDNDEESSVSFSCNHTSDFSSDDINIGIRKLNMGGTKVLKLANPDKNEKGYAAFMYCGSDYIVSFNDNTKKALAEAILNKINEADKKHHK